MGDTLAWHAYQHKTYSTLHPGKALPPFGDKSRPDLWKAVLRQKKQIEAKRTIADAEADADHRPGKKLKVSTRCWQHEHVAGVSDVHPARHAPRRSAIRRCFG